MGHVVTYDANLGSFDQAKVTPNGLAVLGFFFQVGSANSDIQPVVNALGDVGSSGTNSKVDGMNLLDLIEASFDGNFYRYSGSLTTPTCDETVIWTNFQTPISISDDQLKQFRGLDGNDGALVDNFRPTQPLRGRDVTHYA